MNESVAPSLRVMEPRDLTAVATLEARAKSEPWSLALFAGEFDVSPQARHWLVAEMDGQIAGFAGAMLVADETHVLNVVVDPNLRRSGIGRILLSRLLLDSLDRGAVSATLEVRTDNEAAIGLYDQVGFKSSGTRPRYYADGGDAMIMWVHRLHKRDNVERLTQMAAPMDRGQSGD